MFQDPRHFFVFVCFCLFFCCCFFFQIRPCLWRELVGIGGTCWFVEGSIACINLSCLPSRPHHASPVSVNADLWTVKRWNQVTDHPTSSNTAVNPQASCWGTSTFCQKREPLYHVAVSLLVSLKKKNKAFINFWWFLKAHITWKYAQCC